MNGDCETPMKHDLGSRSLSSAAALDRNDVCCELTAVLINHISQGPKKCPMHESEVGSAISTREHHCTESVLYRTHRSFTGPREEWIFYQE